jgi:hypothetical protein
MQVAVSQLTVIGFVTLIQTWVDHFPTPLSGHETRSLGRFNTNSKIIHQGDGVNAPLSRIVAWIEDTFMSEILTLFFNSARSVLFFKTMDKSCNLAEVSL